MFKFVERSKERKAQKEARAEYFQSTIQTLPNGKQILSFWVKQSPRPEVQESE